MFEHIKKEIELRTKRRKDEKLNQVSHPILR